MIIDKTLKIKNIIKSWKDNCNRSYWDIQFLKKFSEANIIVFKYKDINKTILKLETILKELKDKKC